MGTDLARPLSAWIITLTIHSSILVGVGALVAWQCRRRGALSCEEAVWRLAVLGAPITATLQLLLSSASTLQAVMMTLPGLSGDVASRGGSLVGSSWPATLILLAGMATAARLSHWSVGRVRLGAFLSGRRPAPSWMRTVMDELASASGAGVRPRLSLHAGLSAPVAFGLLHPEIAVPAVALGEEADTLRPMLAHELAHLRDRDPLWHALLDLVEVLFPWQLLFRPVRRRLQLISELRCDSHAARWTGARPMARSLVTAAGWMQSSGGEQVHLVDAFVGAGSLEERVDRLLDGSHQWKGPDMRFVGLLLVSLGTLGPVLPGVSAVRGEGITPSSLAAEELPPALEADVLHPQVSGPGSSRHPEPCASVDDSGEPPQRCHGGRRKHSKT